MKTVLQEPQQRIPWYEAEASLRVWKLVQGGWAAELYFPSLYQTAGLSYGPSNPKVFFAPSRDEVISKAQKKIDSWREEQRAKYIADEARRMAEVITL